MSQSITTPESGRTGARGPLVRSIRWGLAAWAVAALASVYGAYGDAHPKTAQENAVPVLIGIAAVLAALLFGLLAPAGLRGAAAKPGRWAGTALALGVLTFLLAVFAWSGVPFLVGTTGALVASEARAAQGAGRKASWAFGANLFAMAVGVAILVLGNMSRQ